MNIKEIVYKALEDAKCIVEEDTTIGIVTVYVPNGDIWDFTIPTDVTDSVNHK